jgi:hypothetical protein
MKVGTKPLIWSTVALITLLIIITVLIKLMFSDYVVQWHYEQENDTAFRFSYYEIV